MGILSRLRNFFRRIFGRRKVFKLGIYGPTNTGKTSLANKISMDWLGEEVGKVSGIPHETREIQVKENIVIESEDGRKLQFTLVDTPGIATKVDYEEFLNYNLNEKEAKQRAKEATKGIIEAIKWLDDMDVVLAMLDATANPYSQINLTILGNLEARKIPVIIVANKIDLKKANLDKIKDAFPQYEVVGISAKTGENIQELYRKIFEISR